MLKQYIERTLQNIMRELKDLANNKKHAIR